LLHTTTKKTNTNIIYLLQTLLAISLKITSAFTKVNLVITNNWPP